MKVLVWSMERIWNKRELEIDCTIEEAKGFSDSEFEEHIRNFGSIVLTECAGDTAEYDLANIEEIDDSQLYTKRKPRRNPYDVIASLNSDIQI